MFEAFFFWSYSPMKTQYIGGIKMNYLPFWKEKIYQIWKKEKRYWRTAALFAVLLWFGVAISSAYSVQLQAGIAQKVLRFHVRANSDSDADQTLKLRVRDRILQEYGRILQDCTSKDESMAVLQAHTAQIAQIAKDEITQAGYSYPVAVTLVREDFPTKQYGDLTFPAGVYDALRIEIGAAKGHNWWCVLYPQMCYVDATWQEVTDESHQKLKHTLSQEEYVVVSALEQEAKLPKIKLKLVELFG